MTALRLARGPVPLALILAVFLGACSSSPSTQPTLRVDRTRTPAVEPLASILTPETLYIEGSATWEEAPLRDLVQRRAVTIQDLDRTAALLASGAYMGDATAFVRLTPRDVTEGIYEAGSAYLPHAFPAQQAPGPFEMNVTLDLEGNEGASAGLTVELRDPNGTRAGDTGQLLVTLLDPAVGRSAQLSVSTRARGSDALYEPVGSAPLAARDWRGSHRITLAYTPGDLSVSLDGELVVSAPVRLDRPVGPVYVGAFASTPTMGVSLVDWTLSLR